ncbi:MAG: GtrA family protein [Janthinobacterium lividum]
MHTPKFVRAQAASAAGTLVDLLVTILSVEVFGSWVLLATVLGNMAGGISNFYLGRYLVFQVPQHGARAQGRRYVLVWLGSMLLNAAGVYLCTQFFRLNYVYSKVVVSLLVGIGFNYFLQLHFVFKQS